MTNFREYCGMEFRPRKQAPFHEYRWLRLQRIGRVRAACIVTRRVWYCWKARRASNSRF